MVCFSPRTAWFKDDGQITFVSTKAKFIDRPFKIRCRQCFGCRRKDACDWATRCVHEQQFHDCSSFLTLTYDNQNVPLDGSLCHRDFQLFMKSFREDNPGLKIRMLMCGEYGEELGRPHFHAIIFGHDFSADRTPFKRGPGGHMIYNSASLDRYWKRGWSTVSDVSFQSAAYVAGYVFKKVYGKSAPDHYERYDPHTGEVFFLKPEYNLASKRPPLGFEWLTRYYEEIFVDDDHIVLTGDRHVGIPRAYRDWYKKHHPLDYEDFKLRTVSSFNDRQRRDLRHYLTVNSDCDDFSKEYSLIVQCVESDYIKSRQHVAAVNSRQFSRKESL